MSMIATPRVRARSWWARVHREDGTSETFCPLLAMNRDAAEQAAYDLATSVPDRAPARRNSVEIEPMGGDQ